MRCLASVVLAVGLVSFGGTVRAEPERFPFPLGVRGRAVMEKDDAGKAVDAGAIEVATAIYAGSSNGRLSGNVAGLFALGTDGSGLSGTLAYALSYGALLHTGSPASGFSIRGGADVLFDSVGSLRASYVALPELQTGYTISNPSIWMDVGLDGAPVVAGRLRRLGRDDAVRHLGLGATAGAYAGLILFDAGTSLFFSVKHLAVGPSDGSGSADWLRGITCVRIAVLDACADGFVERFVPESAHGSTVTLGYAGLLVGVPMWTLGSIVMPRGG